MKKFLLFAVALITALASQAVTVTGRVLSNTQEPVAGANVMFLNGDNSKFGATGADGVFKFEDVVAGSYFLVIQASGFPEYQNPDVSVADADVNLGDIKLETPTNTLEGRVYGMINEQKTELPGALVTVKYTADSQTVTDGPQTTETDGSFLFAKLPQNTDYEVTVTHPVFFDKTVTVHGETSDPEFLDIVLDPYTGGTTVTGRVINKEGQPVTDAILTFTNLNADGSEGLSNYVTNVDGEGKFEQTNMRRETSYRVKIQSANYPEKIIESFAIANEDNLDMGDIVIDAPAGVKVTGRVLTDKSEPVEGATILFMKGDDFFRASTAADGTFTIEPVVNPGSYFLVVQATGYPEYQNPDVPVADADVNLGDIKLDTPTNTLQGRVYGMINEQKTELPGAFVTVKYTAGEETVVLGPQTTETDGSFLFAKLPQNTDYEVTVTHPMFFDKTVTIHGEAGDPEFFDIVLDPYTGGTTVTGRVINEQGEPVTDAILTFTNLNADGSEGLSTYLLNVNEEGKFEQTNMRRETSYIVRIQSANYPEKVIENFTIANEDNLDMGDIVLTTTGIDGIYGPENGKAVYYDFRGVRVANPQPGVIYIRVLNGKAEKVIR